MALTGIQILKLLPKTNCGECKFPTCLAFAMALASGKTELDLCPHVADSARSELSDASAPPIRQVSIGDIPSISILAVPLHTDGLLKA